MDQFHFDFTKICRHASYPTISPTRPELSATGKTVFISGGGRGVGVALVRAFAQAGAAHIISMGRSEASLSATTATLGQEFPSTKFAFFAGSVASEDDMMRAAEFVREKYPQGLDVVVANAGYLHDLGPVAGFSPASSSSPSLTGNEKDKATSVDWWKAYEVNVKGVYLLARLFLTFARSPSSKPGDDDTQQQASFVNISSGGAHVVPARGGFSGYTSSKLGAARLVETLQAEKPQYKFFSVSPGGLQSDMYEKSGMRMAVEAGIVEIDQRECLDDSLPLFCLDYTSRSWLKELSL